MIRSGIFTAIIAFTAVNAFGLPAEQVAAFDFGSAYANSTPTNLYSAEAGFGFEPGADLKLGSNYVTSDRPFSFSVKLPEENYNVTVKLGGQAGESETTVFCLDGPAARQLEWADYCRLVYDNKPDRLEI